ncbi:hypothetical protein Tco_1363375 [Tanacetum coccineum]
MSLCVYNWNSLETTLITILIVFYEVEQALKERERHPINQRVKHPLEPVLDPDLYKKNSGEISLQADRGNGVMCLTMSCKAVRQARYMRSTCADGNSVFPRSQVVKSVFYGIHNLLLMLEETQNFG